MSALQSQKWQLIGVANDSRRQLAVITAPVSFISIGQCIEYKAEAQNRQWACHVMH